MEGRQILSALAGETKGWRNHPATRMFAGHETTLFRYLFSIADAMAMRGYKYENNWQVITHTFQTKFGWTRVVEPDWMLDDRFNKVITTHRANLYLKAPHLYPQYEPETHIYREMVCCDRCAYYWPSHNLEARREALV